jgi:4,5-DOPA dioxygenase extradiol
MIYDMYGFPLELYRVTYPAPGSREMAEEILSTITSVKILEDIAHGLDHGAWSVLVHLFPQADIPVIQMSLDYSLVPEKLFAI